MGYYLTAISMKTLIILNILVTVFPLNCNSSSSFTNKSHEQPVDISALLKSFEVLMNLKLSEKLTRRSIQQL